MTAHLIGTRKSAFGRTLKWMIQGMRSFWTQAWCARRIGSDALDLSPLGPGTVARARSRSWQGRPSSHARSTAGAQRRFGQSQRVRGDLCRRTSANGRRRIKGA